MKILYGISRILLGIILGPSALLGVVWFSDTLSAYSIILGVTLGSLSLIVAFFPQKRLSSHSTRRLLSALCIIGFFAGSLLAMPDMTVPAPNWTAFSIKLLQVSAFGVILLGINRFHSEL